MLYFVYKSPSKSDVGIRIRDRKESERVLGNSGDAGRCGTSIRNSTEKARECKRWGWEKKHEESCLETERKMSFFLLAFGSKVVRHTFDEAPIG